MAERVRVKRVPKLCTVIPIRTRTFLWDHPKHKVLCIASLKLYWSCCVQTWLEGGVWLLIWKEGIRAVSPVPREWTQVQGLITSYLTSSIVELGCPAVKGESWEPGESRNLRGCGTCGMGKTWPGAHLWGPHSTDRPSKINWHSQQCKRWEQINILTDKKWYPWIIHWIHKEGESPLFTENLN